MFLDEDEVDEQVSTIKRIAVTSAQTGPNSYPWASSNELGLYRASFRWNAVQEEKKEKEKDDGKKDKKKWWNVFSPKSAFEANGKKNGKRASPSPPPNTSDLEAALADAAAENISDGEGDEDHVFELRDVSVVFPERQLTLVTGPTASGKTALLVILIYSSYPFSL